MPSMLYTYTPGGSIINHNFLWKLPEDFSVKACLSENQWVVTKLMDTLPVYHTRAMRREFISHYGSLMNMTKPFVLRSMYCELTKDASGSHTFDEDQVDKCLKEAFDCEDFDIIVDMRELNEGCAPKYDEFWKKCEEYILPSPLPYLREGMDKFVLWHKHYLCVTLLSRFLSGVSWTLLFPQSRGSD